MSEQSLPRGIGPYVVDDVMARGGCGVVYRCHHHLSGVIAAVKLPSGAAGSKQAVWRETEMLTRLQRYNAPGVVRVLEHGTERGAPWYAMEYVKGQTLASYHAELWVGQRSLPTSDSATQDAGLREWPTRECTEWLFQSPPAIQVSDSVRDVSLPPIAAGRLEAALRITEGLAEALHLIHSEGVVHGDLSPRNVMLRDSDQTPVLVDFGASFHVSHGGVSRDVAGQGPTLWGTAGYMAPEQLRADELDARCDIYALGCILYELLTGRRPFVGPDAEALARQHLWVTPALVSSYVSGVPPQLDTLVSRLLEKEPSARMGRARELQVVLARLRGQSIKRPGLTEPELLLYRPRFVGRAEELERLQNVGSEARAGRGALIVVGGESGVGKTRFLNEATVQAKLEGFVVIAGRCQPPPGDSRARVTSLEPFVPFLRWASEQLLDTRSSTDGAIRYLTTLQRFTGEQPFEVDSKLPTVSPHLSRGFVLRALAGLVASLAERKPLMLILDDLHWADELTLHFLSGRSTGVAKASVLIVAAYRSEEEPERLVGVKNAAQACIELSRLPAMPTRKLARDYLGASTLPEGLAEFLYRHSEGNPLLVGEYLRACIASGVVAPTSTGSWDFDPRRTSRIGEIPETTRALFTSRFERLGGEAREGLGLAAVLGREFEVEAFVALSEMGAHAARTALGELTSRQILESSVTGCLRFGHDKLREAALSLLPDERRRQLHRVAAEWLERQQAPGTGAEIGIHWAYAAEPARSLPWLNRAALQASAEYAWDRAEELLRLAIEQNALLGADHSGLAIPLAGLYEALGDALVALAKHAQAEASLDSAQELLPREARLQRARVLRKRARSVLTRHDYAAATRYLLDAGEQLRHAPPSVEATHEHIEIELTRFDCLYFSRRVGEETALLLEELAPKLQAASTSLRASYFVCAAGHAAARAGYTFSSDAVALATRGLADDLTGVPLDRVAELNLVLGFSLMASDDPSDQERALMNLNEAERCAAAAGDNTMVSRVLTYSTLTLVRLGRVREVLCYAARASHAADVAQLPPYVACAAAAEGWAFWREQDRQNAPRLLEYARELWAAHPHPFPFRWVGLFPLLDLYLELDRLDEIAAIVTELTAPSQQRLPEPIRQTLAATEQALSVGSVRAIRDGVSAAVSLARVLRYA